MISLHQNQVPELQWDCLRSLDNILRYLIGITNDCAFLNVNISDNINVAIGMVTIIISFVAAFSVVGVHVFNSDILHILAFLNQVIDCLNQLLHHLDNIVTNLANEGPIGDRALNQYMELQANATSLMQHYNTLADHVNLEPQFRQSLETLR